MSASQAGAIGTLCVITPRDHLTASAGRVTMATATTALQVSLLSLFDKQTPSLTQTVHRCQLTWFYIQCGNIQSVLLRVYFGLFCRGTFDSFGNSFL